MEEGKTRSPAEKLLKKANRFYEKGNYRYAAKLFSKLLDLEPNNADAYFYRATSYYLLNKYDLAITINLSNPIRIISMHIIIAGMLISV